MTEQEKREQEKREKAIEEMANVVRENCDSSARNDRAGVINEVPRMPYLCGFQDFKNTI